eukprot:8088073-Alexandrium_andersonii.AAC.1
MTVGARGTTLFGCARARAVWCHSWGATLHQSAPCLPAPTPDAASREYLPASTHRRCSELDLPSMKHCARHSELE